ncbi:stigma-specific STIG1-like protein 2 [Brassica rapa]|uniref:Stigma-specific STIG1-like protein 1 n=1 Tax=Brassica campestris TaxID=3711 RepID=M4EJM4_BRACM|nr:stigma-specific STIG1-like protein 2 [Brassica rapa]
MAQFMKLLVTIALTFAITTAIITTTTTRTNPRTETFALKDPLKDLTPPGANKIRPSRFLAQRYDEGQRPKARNSNAAGRCNKDSEICSSTAANSTMTCCNKKCIDLSTDRQNCGACKKICKYGEICCGGQCVSWRYDPRHCGKCNNRCKPFASCYAGLCEYA